MQKPPTGTVTFIFTDIEGSTKLWEQYPETMKPALARHDTILRDAVEKNSGYIVKMRGDGIHAAFASATDALAAALAAQRAIFAEKWGVTGRLRVRIAMHTGAVQERDGDYFGSPVNRAARLLSCGHGDQVLLSDATQELVREQLPPSVRLHDLGTHRLKDLIEREHIYQMIAPDLPAAFPRLITLDTRPTNLPAQSTPLIGRENQVSAAQRLLRQKDVRLISLIGPGGVGKTRLALQVAGDLIDDFEHGVYFVRLAPNSDSASIAFELSHSLGIRENSSQSIGETLKSFLRDKQMLLLLDDFAVANAPLLNEWLIAAPRLKALVTNRVRLEVRGENDFPVLPLALPDPGRLIRAGADLASAIARTASVELFVQRASAANPNFRLTNENALAISEICTRLYGIPLAIQLVAARCRMHTPQDILQQLTGQSGWTQSESWDSTAQRNTLHLVRAWSYDLLSDGEKTLFRRLAVFVGGFTLEAAEAVCGKGDAPTERPDSGTIVASRRLAFTASMNTADAVTSLLGKSFLRADSKDGSETRYAMLETIRAYALELLAKEEDAPAIHRGQAQYFLDWVEKLEPKLRGAEQSVWLERVDQEYQNLNAALDWAKRNKETEIGLRLAGALWRYWHTRGYLSEGCSWLEEFAALAKSTELSGLISVRAKVFNGLGALAHAQGNFESAQDFYEQALALRRKMEDASGVAALLNNLGLVAQKQRDLKRAAKFFKESQVLRRKLNDKWGIAQSLGNLGMVAQQQGNDKKAREFYEESLELFRELKDKRSIAMALNSLADLARLQEDYARASKLVKESQNLFRELGDEWGIAHSLNTQADVAQFQGDYLQAKHLYNQCLSSRRALDDKVGIAFCLEGLAAVACAQDKTERAARLLGAAEGLRELIRSPLPTIDQANLDRCRAAALAKLGESKFDSASGEGRAMSLEQAIEFVLKEAYDATT